MYNKAQLTNALGDYIKAEIVPHITDMGTKTFLGAFAFALKRDPDLINGLLENPMIQSLGHKTSDGEYNFDSMIDSLGESIREYGNMVIIIPKIPLVSPDPQRLSFSSNDLEKLKGYLDR